MVIMVNIQYLITYLLPFLLILISDVTAQENTKCTTPNKEEAICKPISSCNVILDAIKTRNQSAIEFGRESQCGFKGKVPLVCCGSTAYLTPTTPDPLEEIYGLFDKNRDDKNKDTEKEQLETIILQDFNTKQLPERTVCGLEREGDRIWGGTETDLGEFPWMVAMEYKNKIEEPMGIRCGGSLINNRFVLTAAHCLLHREFILNNVRLGEWKISTDPDCQKLIAHNECADNVLKINVKSLLPHPFYSKKSGNNDIGLVRLEKDVQFTDYIRPICMPPLNLPAPPFNSLLTVAGWGITENDTTSDIKLKVKLPLLQNDICRSKLDGKEVSANQLCAGGDLGKDSCQGDSGGPLMRTYEDGVTKQSQWYQEGVVSLGVGCARAGYPAVYTRVSRYINWIINNISDE